MDGHRGEKKSLNIKVASGGSSGRGLREWLLGAKGSSGVVVFRV